MKHDVDDTGSPHGDFTITRRVELNFWKTCLLNSAGLLLAWLVFPCIKISDPFSFAALVMLIWFLNWILRPLLVVFTLPFIIFTVGIGMLFINAFIIYIAARLVPGDGVRIPSYWVALGASFFVSTLSWGEVMLKSERIIRQSFKGAARKDGKNSGEDDVIDV